MFCVGLLMLVSASPACENGVDVSSRQSSNSNLYLVGESLTNPGGEWPEQLNALLGSGYVFYNVAIGGTGTDQMLARFDTDVVNATPSPDWVTILSGTHDVSRPNEYTLAGTEYNLQQMYNKAHAAGIKVIAITIPPCDFQAAVAEQQNFKLALDDWIMHTAANVDYRIDIYPLLDDGAGGLSCNNTVCYYNIGSDHQHLSYAGGTVVANAIYAGVDWSGVAL